jgi:L-lysine 2,3-aminomutase
MEWTRANLKLNEALQNLRKLSSQFNIEDEEFENAERSVAFFGKELQIYDYLLNLIQNDRKQMNQLADIIVDKIISRQAEYDAEFMKNLAEHDEIDEIHFMAKPIKTNEEIILLNIERLEGQLQKAIEEEDYMSAEELKKSIQKFKDKL